MSDTTGIFKSVRRIIAIGDIHGDYEATIQSLKLAGCIKLNGTRWHWCGGKTYVVQLGDQLDRKCREDMVGGDEDSEVKIMKFFDYLDEQAKKEGGRVLSLAGNHDFMQSRGMFHYVSAKGLAHFGGAEKRRQAFKPGGEMAKYMSDHRYAVIKIGPFIFVHGGVMPRIADKYTIPEINKKCREYLAGTIPWSRELSELFESNDSLLWTRHYGGPRPNCEKLDHVLKKWNGRAMIVGHTPQEHGITSACNDKVWRVDVGLSAAILGSDRKADRVQVLEITQAPNKSASIHVLSALHTKIAALKKERVQNAKKDTGVQNKLSGMTFSKSTSKKLKHSSHQPNPSVRPLSARPIADDAKSMSDKKQLNPRRIQTNHPASHQIDNHAFKVGFPQKTEKKSKQGISHSRDPKLSSSKTVDRAKKAIGHPTKV